MSLPSPRKRRPYAGWFVEVPRDLKEEFQRLYPGRAAMKKLTVAFIKWAIRMKPDLDTLEKGVTPDED